jgi:hypothetical protein
LMEILARGRREWRGAPASTSWLQISKAAAQKTGSGRAPLPSFADTGRLHCGRAGGS